MTMINNLSTSQFIKTSFSPRNSQDLSLDSTLQELPLHDCQIETSYLGQDLAQIFDSNPLLPGAILKSQGEFVGMISRQQFLEYLLHPQGIELFLPQPLQTLHSYARQEPLIMPGDLPILTAAKQALRRSPLQQLEPIIVQLEPSVYRLLEYRQLNLASWQIRGLETQVRYERTQVQMLQSEKMASLGRLVDGIAHEILDPVSFIWGNVSHISAYSDSLLKLLQAYQELIPQTPQNIVELQQEMEFDFLFTDLPRACESVKSGSKRLKELASSLQNFCHIDDVYPKPADLHRCLDSIILLLQSRLQNDIKIVRDYGHLPPFTCYVGQLSQVFMNILSNAIDVLINQAVSRKITHESTYPHGMTQEPQPCITITTAIDAEESPNSQANPRSWVTIRITDNGAGMSEQLQQQVRESFTVEKRADKETSLAFSYQIITAKHGGKFQMQSYLGKGTEFTIILPL